MSPPDPVASVRPSPDPQEPFHDRPCRHIEHSCFRAPAEFAPNPLRDQRRANPRLCYSVFAWKRNRGSASHVRYADTWSIREQVLGRFAWGFASSVISGWGRAHHPKTNVDDTDVRKSVVTEAGACADLIEGPVGVAQYPRILAARPGLPRIFMLVPAPLPDIARQIRYLLQAVSSGIHAYRRSPVYFGLVGVRKPVAPVRAPGKDKIRTRALSRPLPLLFVGQTHFISWPTLPVIQRQKAVASYQDTAVTG